MLRKVIGIVYFRYLSGIYFLYVFEGGGFRWVTETREGDTVKSFLQLINHSFSSPPNRIQQNIFYYRPKTTI